jgi:hypothetical protein
VKRMAKAVLVVVALTASTWGVFAGESIGRSNLAPIDKPQPGRLTLQEMGTMLENLCYNPKSYNDKDGQLAGYDLEFASGTWTIRCCVSLSRDKSNLWFTCLVAKVTDSANVSSTALLGLLEENRNIWPSYVYFLKSLNGVQLTMPVPNLNLTPGKMRKEVEGFGETIKMLITRYKKDSQPVQVAPAVASPR